MRGKSLSIFLVICLGLGLLFFSGCGVVDWLTSMREGTEAEPAAEDFSERGLEEKQEYFQAEEAEAAGKVEEEKIKVVLFFSDPTATNLIGEERLLTKVEGIGRKTVGELIKGPAPYSGLQPTIPSGTELLDIHIDPEGLCIVDFSQEFVANHSGGSSAELLTVYSVVDTLAQFSTVDKVLFRVEGEHIDTLAGHMDLSVPVEPQMLK